MNTVSKRYKKKIVLNNASIDIQKHEITLIVGPNGSGKTTLFKILNGLIRKYEGNIACSDCVLVEDVPTFFKNKSGNENLRYFLNAKEYEKAEMIFKKFMMQEYIDIPFKAYSQGMRKKLAIVLGFSKESEILLLDEPTNGLDEEAVLVLKKVMKEETKQKAIVVASHDTMSFDDSFINKKYLIKNGEILEIAR